MTLRDFTANVISASKVVPDGNFKDSKASGVWDINEALDLIKGGNWPNAANIDPSAFVDALFSIDLITGATGTARTITNGIDLSNKKGVAWGKDRTAGDNHRLSTTLSGAGQTLDTANTYAKFDNAGVQGATQFNSNGFVSGMTDSYFNNHDIVYWTFREQPKFFDLVQFTGTGSVQNISHNLGSVPGMIWVKRTDSTGDWAAYHRGVDSSAPEDYIIFLNKDSSRSDSGSYWNDTAPTSSVFTVGTESAVNASGGTYLAFLFAHNNDDGGFGEPGNQDIIKCGSYTGNAGNPQVIDVGFEPQLLMVKATSTTGEWQVVDNMRGVLPNGAYPCNNLYWNDTDAETLAGSFGFFANGFTAAQSSNTNGNGVNFIYMAIRRGGMQTPTAGTDVFAMDTYNSSGVEYISNFPVDFVFWTNPTAEFYGEVYTRLTAGKRLQFMSNAAEGTRDTEFDHNEGFSRTNFANSNLQAWMWKRARGYFDVVAYSGTGSARTVSHNLGAVPEMMWVKSRSSSDSWQVYHSALGNEAYLQLNNNNAQVTGEANRWNSTTPTASVFSIGTSGSVNGGSDTYIAYLFATVANVSKVGSYTGNGGSQTINCGFSSGARFVLIKRTDQAADWKVYDTVRGIVAGNDPELALNSIAAQVTGYDYIDPDSSGFILPVDNFNTNASGASYIFYAIA